MQAKLRSAGISTLVRTGNKADGQLVYRVCVGYFASRDDAVTYARENRKALGTEGIAVHR
jgi:hypothetical protein